MRASLIIARYPRWALPFGLLSMALFRLPLLLNKNISFWRLMGSGKNGSFNIVPDLRQWAILLVQREGSDPSLHASFTGSGFIDAYFKLFKASVTGFLLQPVEGHGCWNGRQVFGELPGQTNYEGKIAVLTRATIRLSQLKDFWQHVPVINRQIKKAPGLLSTYGIGEIPLVKQATFSVWESKAAMISFAYGLQEHREVIRQTRSRQWYREEMFVRFIVCQEVRIVY